MTTTDDDPQRAVFAESTAVDWASQASLLAAAVFHTPDDPDAEPIRTPEQWNADAWDEARQGPKTVDEARDALAARIADQHAPDTDAVAGAYDELED